jgi:DNA-binding LacI/PurR family transcriptional regulator
MANQRDVAARAGLSSATVSRYLANPESVSPQAAQAIQGAIAELDYRLDTSAQALRMGKSRHIAVLSPGGGEFHWSVFTQIQQVLHGAGYYSTLYLTESGGGEAHASFESLSAGRQIDGVLHIATEHPSDDETIARLTEWGRPLVVIDRPLPGPVCQVYVDNYGAGRRAARELLDRGHREFLFVWGLRHFPSARNRFLGFRDGLLEAGIELTADRQLDGGFYSLTSYSEASRRWNDLPRFTAVFASNDSSALGFLKAAREHGLRAPADFSLIGFDNVSEFSLLLDAALATFGQPTAALGRQAAQLLLSLLAGRNPEPSSVALEAEFIPRDSLGPAPQK